MLCDGDGEVGRVTEFVSRRPRDVVKINMKHANINMGVLFWSSLSHDARGLWARIVRMPYATQKKPALNITRENARAPM